MHNTRHRYFVINKPHGMLSQFMTRFEGEQHLPMLGALDFPFPEGTHAIGRLDKDSEGLLLLTTNQRVTRLLFNSKVPHERTYLVKVKHAVTAEKLLLLQTGIPIRIKGGLFYTTPPCNVQIVSPPAHLFARLGEPPDYGKVTWLRITLTEGKYHQVRKMVSNAGHRCLRLIRVSIEALLLGDLQPGQVLEIGEEDFFTQLKIENWQPAALRQ
ncbi:23S rRNA pseudouridine2457 synthase [Chitinophaga costaii]|uniref:Pseudouridine synthase n=1 Tax=Chitinophaga costaii TaxID=1335309 RepID=A0A1C4EIQ1_9BACT|nr:pseudouridine synthase [Chitinophaga costaii]PUZ23803.1 pseudouridine synthase [Chitinophaga costaii]SCC43362.1 23S rRNA pseudouridine2457 synthase [Chitinophaga costaii]